eukprot:Rhum_TRINITY_DN14277_c14_g1::Rhum_TRINITY_DN14277_c14_g1_i1::g.77880::m.77880
MVTCGQAGPTPGMPQFDVQAGQVLTSQVTYTTVTSVDQQPPSCLTPRTHTSGSPPHAPLVGGVPPPVPNLAPSAFGSVYQSQAADTDTDGSSCDGSDRSRDQPSALMRHRRRSRMLGPRRHARAVAPSTTSRHRRSKSHKKHPASSQNSDMPTNTPSHPLLEAVQRRLLSVQVIVTVLCLFGIIATGTISVAMGDRSCSSAQEGRMEFVRLSMEESSAHSMARVQDAAKDTVLFSSSVVQESLGVLLEHVQVSANHLNDEVQQLVSKNPSMTPEQWKEAAASVLLHNLRWSRVSGVTGCMVDLNGTTVAAYAYERDTYALALEFARDGQVLKGSDMFLEYGKTVDGFVPPHDRTRVEGEDAVMSFRQLAVARWVLGDPAFRDFPEGMTPLFARMDVFGHTSGYEVYTRFPGALGYNKWVGVHTALHFGTQTTSTLLHRAVENFVSTASHLHTGNASHESTRMYTCVARNWATGLEERGTPSREDNQVLVLTGVSHGVAEGGVPGVPIRLFDIEATDPVIRGVVRAVRDESGTSAPEDGYDAIARSGRVRQLEVLVGRDRKEDHIVSVSRMNLTAIGVDWWVVVSTNGGHTERSLAEDLASLEAAIAVRSRTEDEKLSKARDEMKMIIACVGLLLMALAAVITYFVTEPIKRVQEEMREVAMLNLSAARDNSSSSYSFVYEVKQIQCDFIKMVDNLVEFKAYVPPSVLQEPDPADQAGLSDPPVSFRPAKSRPRLSDAAFGSFGSRKTGSPHHSPRHSAKFPTLHDVAVATEPAALAEASVAARVRRGSAAWSAAGHAGAASHGGGGGGGENSEDESAGDAPTGLVTIVVVNACDTVRLWDACPNSMCEVVEGYRRAVRALCEEYGGYEVKHIDDSFMLAFGSLERALACCLRLQEAMESRTLPGVLGSNPDGLTMQIGVHMGMAVPEENVLTQRYDYRGSVVPTACWLAGAAKRGTICMTQEAAFSLERDNTCHSLEMLCDDQQETEPSVHSRVSAQRARLLKERMHRTLPDAPAPALCFSVQEIKGMGTQHLLMLTPERLSERLTRVPPLVGEETLDSRVASSDGGSEDDERAMRTTQHSVRLGVKPRGLAAKTQLFLKRSLVSVAVCKMLQTMDISARTCSLEGVFGEINTVVHHVADAARRCGSSISSMGAGRVYVTWNASSRCPQHCLAAFRLAEILRRPLEEVVTVGLATGTTLHGNVGTQRLRFPAQVGLPLTCAEAASDHAEQLGVFSIFVDASITEPPQSSGIGTVRAREQVFGVHLYGGVFTRYSELRGIVGSFRLLDVWRYPKLSMCLRVYNLDTAEMAHLVMTEFAEPDGMPTTHDALDDARASARLPQHRDPSAPPAEPGAPLVRTMREPVVRMFVMDFIKALHSESAATVEYLIHQMEEQVQGGGDSLMRHSLDVVRAASVSTREGDVLGGYTAVADFSKAPSIPVPVLQALHQSDLHQQKRRRRTLLTRRTSVPVASAPASPTSSSAPPAQRYASAQLIV